MKYFDTIDSATFHQQTFAYIIAEEVDKVLTITLNREKKKNALHPKMIHELAYAFQYAHSNKDIWVIVVAAKGQVFCAGADLKAMMGQVEQNDSTVPNPDGEILIAELFNKVHKPTIAKITGDVYAGGFFFLAGANIVIANNDVKLGLPEVKRGLYPFQVMSALMDVMPNRKVIDWCIRGYNLPVLQAVKHGLVTELVSSENIDAKVDEVIAELKANSPTAIRNGLIAVDHLKAKGEEHKYLFKMLMDTATSKDGQEGLKAFREKRTPVWVGE